MAEQTESVRADETTRVVKQKEKIDWRGRRLVIPSGATLPAVSSGKDAELFIKINDAASNEIYMFDEWQNNWVTVWP